MDKVYWFETQHEQLHVQGNHYGGGSTKQQRFNQIIRCVRLEGEWSYYTYWNKSESKCY